MSWNHRVILHEAGQSKDNPDLKWDEHLAIHEVYYDKNDNPVSVTKESINIIGDEGKDSLIAIKWTLEKMIEALQKPILNYNTLEEINKEKQNEFSTSIEKKE